MSLKRREELKQYLSSPAFQGIQESDYTWNELGSLYGLSGEVARAIWRRVKKEKPDTSKNKTLVEFCKENGLDINTVKEARFITHLGKDKETFNVTLNPHDIRKTILLEIHESIRETFKDFTPQITYNPFIPKETKTVEILSISDLHIGMDIPTSPYGYKWNKEELFNRLTTMVAVFENKISKTQPDKLVLNILGDITDGQDGMTTRGLKGVSKHKLPQNMTNNEMFNTTLSFFRELLILLTKHQLPVTINYVSNSNHGGLLDYTVGRTLEELCKLQYPKLVFNLNTDFISKTESDSVDILTTHGYDEETQSKFNRMPLHLNQTWLLKLNNYKTRLKCKNDTCLLFRGDLHRANMCSYQNFEDIMIPAFCPPSTYIQSNFDYDLSKSGFTMVTLEDNQYSLQNYYFDQN